MCPSPPPASYWQSLVAVPSAHDPAPDRTWYFEPQYLDQRCAVAADFCKYIFPSLKDRRKLKHITIKMRCVCTKQLSMTVLSASLFCGTAELTIRTNRHVA